MIAAALFAAAVAAQQPPRVEETIDVSLVNVDVIVTDKQGKHVRGLKAEDFVIYEGREKRAITNFSEYTAPDPQEAAEGKPVAVVSRQPRTYLIILDTQNLTPLQRKPLFDALRKVLLTTVADQDQVAVVTLAPRYHVNVQLSRSRKEIAASFEAIEHDVGHRSIDSMDIDNTAREDFFAEMASFQQNLGVGGAITDPGDEEGVKRVVETKRRMHQLRALFSDYAAIEGRKIAILVSDFFNGGKDRQEFFNTYSLLEEIASAASEAAFTLYSIHPRGIDAVLPGEPDRRGGGPTGREAPAGASEYETAAQERNSQNALIEASGGAAFFGPGEMPNVTKQIDDDLSDYYSLAFRRDTKQKDRSANIRVETRDRSLRVRSRHAIRLPGVETSVKDRLLANLFDAAANNDLDVAVEADASNKPGKKVWNVPIEITVDSKQLVAGPDGKMAFTVYVSAADRDGNVAPIVQKRQPIDDPAALPDRLVYDLELELRPAPHVISVGVFDEYGRQSGFARTIVAPP
jgi:VWFA-related protein